jgi:predicted nucleotidyltransferase component of viral defense system
MHEGAEIEIPGLGVLKNWSTKVVTEEDAAYFRVVRGRDLLDAFKNVDYVKVEVHKKEKEKQKEEAKPAATEKKAVNK